MDIQTAYGICRHVDIDHLVTYGCNDSSTSTFIFTDYIIDNKYSYLLFGFEVLHDRNNEFRFFVEEGSEDGSADTYKAEISRTDQEEIKKIYAEYISRQ